MDNKSFANFASKIEQIWNQLAEIDITTEAKFTNNSEGRIIFYDIIGYKTKASCLNIMHHLLKRNLNNWYHMYRETWETFRITFFVVFMGLITRGGRRHWRKVLNIQWMGKGYQNWTSTKKTETLVIWW